MSENRASADILTRKVMSSLLYQHEAIRSQMRFLIKGITNIFIQSNLEISPPTSLSEKISLYRYSLDDFQEAIRRHNGLYEHIEMLYGGFFNEELMIEQKEIEKQLDNIVRIAHNAVYHGLQRDELGRFISDIIERVNRICETIDVHMTKEKIVLE